MNKKNKKKQGKVKKSVISGKALIAIIAVSVILLAAVITTVILVTRGNDGSAGWQEVTAQDVDKDFSERFILNYDVDEKNGADYDTISKLYGSKLSRLYSIFYDTSDETDIKGLSYLNARIGLETEVEPELYHAFELCLNHGDRLFTLGPVFEYYNKIFESARDSAAALYDPHKNSNSENICMQLMSYASDDNFISVTLYGENRVLINVSSEYSELMSDLRLKSYVGFGWLTDAFIVDEIADAFTSEGYTHGSISSYDGFIRNMTTDNSDYSFGLYDLYRDNVYLAASISYKGALSTVNYKKFSMNDIDGKYLYSYGGGDVAHRYVDAETGQYLAACDSMLFHAKEMGCADLALSTYSQYVREVEDKEAISELLELGIGAVYCDGTNIIHTSDDISIHDLYSSDSVNYTVTK